jgi:F-type H+-transporting ATPase subunit gamma
MPNARDIRRRIKSVKNIQQITKAMEMVAAARLRRAQEKAAACLPYVDKLQQTLESVAAHSGNRFHPLLRKRAGKKALYLIVSADKGLAGAYTSNLLREAVSHMKQSSSDVGMIVTGRKGRDYFRRRGYALVNSYVGSSERPRFGDAGRIGQEIFHAFATGEYDAVYVVYTRFYSPMNQKPMVKQVLPLAIEGVAIQAQAPSGAWHKLKGYFQEEDSQEKPVWAKSADADAEETVESVDADSDDTHATDEAPDDVYIVEPSPTDVLNRLLPRYMEAIVYEALLQSAASELGARMTAMGSATTNAQEIISELTLNYNKVRQSAITREISEIVGGVEALQ